VSSFLSLFEAFNSNQNSPVLKADLGVISYADTDIDSVSVRPDKVLLGVFLPGNVRRELAVKSRVTG